MNKHTKQDKGVAGLTILLSLVVMLFAIGLLVMIFAIMGNKLQDSTYTSTAVTVVNESVTPSTSGTSLAVAGYRGVACGTITQIWNATNHISISAGNYTQTGCSLANKTDTYPLGWKVNYPYTYDADNSATNVMNATTSSVAGVSDWFDIFIVIGAMVVLILLTVIIITAIRSSGLIGGTQSAGANKVGTA